MKAVVHDVYGSADVLRIDDIPDVEPGAREVLVRVHAAGVDIGQWHLMTGTPTMMRMFMGRRGPRARVRGLEFSGHVERVGAKVTRFRPGDAVFGTAPGALAERVVAKENQIAHKPDSVAFSHAAACAVSGVTAVQAIAAGRVTAGQRVLVLGAAGDVGSFVTQLALAAGAHVTGLARASKVATVRGWGVDDVRDYAVHDVTDGSEQWDVIIDTGGNRTLRALRRALTRSGTLVIVGGEGVDGALGGFDRLLRAGLLSPFVGQRLIGLTSVTKVPALESIAGSVERGDVTPLIDREYPFDDAVAAMRRLESREGTGHVVVTGSELVRPESATREK